MRIPILAHNAATILFQRLQWLHMELQLFNAVADILQKSQYLLIIPKDWMRTYAARERATLRIFVYHICYQLFGKYL